MIDILQAEKIASLSRLSLTEDELSKFGGQLSNILRYVEKLSELDIKYVEPTAHVLDISNVMRPDAPRPSLNIDDALANAPDRAGNFYRVPKIIE